MSEGRRWAASRWLRAVVNRCTLRNMLVCGVIKGYIGVL